jgi:hypothetical protein
MIARHRPGTAMGKKQPGHAGRRNNQGAAQQLAFQISDYID